MNRRKPLGDRILASHVAAMLGRSSQWFSSNRARLEAAGFPRPLPVANTYDPEEVRAWVRGATKTPRTGRLKLAEIYRANHGDAASQS